MVRNNFLRAYLIGIFLFLFVSNASSTTFIVCPSGCTYSSIQTAIDAASPGDTIEVQSGTYFENVNVTKTLTLLGNDTGTGKPLVNAAGIGSAITLSADGITLKGFDATRSGTRGSIDAGIKVISHNNLIQDNNAYNNGDNGILLNRSNLNKLYNNTAFDNENAYGIFLVTSSNNILFNNTANSNGYYGIQLVLSSSNNILTGNIARFNRDYGFVLAYSSNNNLLNGNYMTNNGWGIHFYLSDYNTLENNIISENGVGIWLVASNNNKFYNNNIILINSNNGAYDWSNHNFWDNGIIGNHWSYFDEPTEGCNDADSNGICDMPYPITGSSNFDHYPLLSWSLPSDNPPNISITFPADGQTFSTDTVTVSGTASDNIGLSKVEVKVGTGAWQIASGTASWSTTVTLSQGSNTIYARATDTSGNTNDTSVTVTLDTEPPQVTINSPIEGNEYTLNQIVLADWSAEDLISGLASSTGTKSSGEPIDTATVGTKAFSVNAEDNAGNKITETRSYFVHYSYGGILQPINTDGSSIFKLGRTIPVKFQLTDVDGNYVSNANANIFLIKIDDDISGDQIEPSSSSAVTTGNQFRYDSDNNQYIYNLGTKDLSVGTWQIRIAFDDGASKYATISLRK
jgi:parallel beta-helix repeat protein